MLAIWQRCLEQREPRLQQDFQVLHYKDSLQRCDVAEYSDSLPAGLYSLRHRRISSQASQSSGRCSTRGARQILLCTKTLHQSHYKTEVWEKRHPRYSIFRCVVEGELREYSRIKLYEV